MRRAAWSATRQPTARQRFAGRSRTGRPGAARAEALEREQAAQVGAAEDAAAPTAESVWSGLTALRLERDEFENLDLRSNIDLGAGYFVVRRDHHEFKPRAGVGVQTEAFSNRANQEDVVGVLGWDYRYDMSTRWRFTHMLDYRPTFSDPTGAFRIDSDAALSTALDVNSPWRLELRVRTRSMPMPNPASRNWTRSTRSAFSARSNSIRRAPSGLPEHPVHGKVAARLLFVKHLQTAAVAVVRGVMFKGAGPGVLWPGMAAHAAFTLAVMVLTLLRFRRTLE